MSEFKITNILRFTILSVSTCNTRTVQHKYTEVRKMETQQTLSFETTGPIDRKSSSRLVFEQLVNETIDNVFSSLGTVGRLAIYDYLETEHALKRNDIADHIMEFSEALEQIFGVAAALLEIQIMKKLCRKVPKFKHWQEGSLTFPDYVNALSHFIGTR
jgi:hypothetical protein